MDSPRPQLDLEKELTCSICTELLYQPLTLLDCLHTFCGACLKDWFGFQAATAENARTPPAAATVVFTCPSCRAQVRDTKHNATVATLLDMFLTANPGKDRDDLEKGQMAQKYKPGDSVLPSVTVLDRPAAQLQADEEERRLIQEVREMSLRELGVASSLTPSSRRRRDESRSSEGRRQHARESSHGGRSRHTQDSAGRPRGDERRVPSDESRHRRSGSRNRSDTLSEIQRRQVEHQSSLRSLIGSANMSERAIAREIEEFARQIQEEGLLDGLDLDNIDLTRDDELSRKITEAYRRRQRERSRHEASPRSRGEEARDSGSHRRSASSSRQSHERSRPPPAPSAVTNHLEVQGDERRRRRRTPSRERSSTAPTYPPQLVQRTATRSQTDLSVRSHQGDSPSARHVFSEARSSSSPTVTSSNPGPTETTSLSFANRVPPVSNVPSSPAESIPSEPSPGHIQRNHRPADLSVISQSMSTFNPLGISSPTSPGHKRTRSQLYPEPSIACSRCNRTHIEYEVHYNCSTCSSGGWNLCLDCYRAGKGCLHWFGFGYAAWNKWERVKQSRNADLPRPHMLTANRYVPPKRIPGGAEGRQTLTTDDPSKRLQSGNFCARCFAWSNGCYWRCDHCNDGDWGFCDDCVNQGRSCTHTLLPLTYEPSQPQTPPASPGFPHRPQSASIMPGVTSIGPFKPLAFVKHCEVCRQPIVPTEPRYHCFSCTSSVTPDASVGDYDICSPCYADLVSRHEISAENGVDGWKRCLAGHRMITEAYQDGRIGQRRSRIGDLVGGRQLQSEAIEGPEAQGLLKWSWKDGSLKKDRLVTTNVSAVAPTNWGPFTSAPDFPPEGGAGSTAVAGWLWYGLEQKAEDELYFPRGAEVREVEDVNGDWFYGVYLDRQGLFPSGYVKLVSAKKP